MAVTHQTSSSGHLSTTSYETALCLIPPQHQCQDIDKLRSLYDKSYGKWPPHVNLIYPFVAPENQARTQIESFLKSRSLLEQNNTVTLNRAGYFKHRNNSTVFIQEATDTSIRSALEVLRSTALQSLGQTAGSCDFHLTVGQPEDDDSSRNFLISKAKLLPSVSFPVQELAILIREATIGTSNTNSRMRLWGTINVQASTNNSLREFWLNSEKLDEPRELVDESDVNDGVLSTQTQPGITFQFVTRYQRWVASTSTGQEQALPTDIHISSYNVLIDSEYPPSRDRDPLLLSTILSESALADIIVLQEVSDDFLSYLLSDVDLRRQYPFTSHGPPEQADIGPLPSLRNVVILSKWHFTWEFVPFHRRHKGAIVAKFSSILGVGAEASLPLCVAGIHLTCGLTDGSVAAKKIQLQNLTNHLKRNYHGNPWVVSGDFNITTSRYTIDQAVKNKAISQQTMRTLESVETMLTEASLVDTWVASKVAGVDRTTIMDADDLFEGEEGSTFNPRENILAAATSGTSNNRPQRYDRILVGPQGNVHVSGFNQFGLPEICSGSQQVPSDHSGVRASIKVISHLHQKPSANSDILEQYPVSHVRAQTNLSNTQKLMETLSKHAVFPSAEEEQTRKVSFELIKQVILGSSNDDEHLSVSDVSMVIVPVGSYALGVWTPSSDVDCLCIGSISSKTFFKLARQRIHQAESQGIRLLRRVEANTGTMLELSVNGINMDLQYCPAASIAQRWSSFPNLHPSDPIFNLSMLSLRKLKPIRDLTYIQRTLPSVASFRLAYHLIKQWAVERGIYSSKFGYFSGVHITLMLSWVCKRLIHDIGSVGAGDLIASFFRHYSQFDWKNDMVFDAFFHKRKPRYQRSVREPMVILGFHSPNSNIAHTSTTPGVDVLVKELQRADARLSMPEMTWEGFLQQHDDAVLEAQTAIAANEFLSFHESYAKIDIQYWGRTLSKGKGLIGWVESRCINLVIDINKALPRLSVRIWPARFADQDSNSSDSYYHGCYLIGLSQDKQSNASASKEDRTQAKIALQKAFDRFLTQVRSDDKYYDESLCWVGVSLAKPNEVHDLNLDDREWGQYIAEAEPDSDDEEDVAELDDEPSNIQSTRIPQTKSSTSNTTSSAPVASKKLRPASEVLNRLRWDPNLDPSEYIVGYEDRFLGAKETSLEKWKTEQTDEEFIPQHRILYFRKKDVGIVWERKTRVDKIFGSGAGDGGEPTEP